MREEKRSMAEAIRRRLKQSSFVVLADYMRMNVQQIRELRTRLGRDGVRFQVVKNRIFRLVAAEFGWRGIEAGLKGASAMVTAESDKAAVGVAKTLQGFARETERPAIKLGVLGNQVISAKEIAALAALPSRQVLLAQLAGTVAAPLSGLAGAMTMKLASLAQALRAVEEKKQRG